METFRESRNQTALSGVQMEEKQEILVLQPSLVSAPMGSSLDSAYFYQLQRVRLGLNYSSSPFETHSKISKLISSLSSLFPSIFPELAQCLAHSRCSINTQRVNARDKEMSKIKHQPSKSRQVWKRKV
jgi:hypothetical protein